MKKRDPNKLGTRNHEQPQRPAKRKIIPIDDDSSDSGSESVDDNRPVLEKPACKSKAPIADQYVDWDNGELLTTKQRKSIMALKSNYERAQAVNEIKNKRKLHELGLETTAKHAFDGQMDGKRKSKEVSTATLSKPNPEMHLMKR
jgi:hypothetical protein